MLAILAHRDVRRFGWYQVHLVPRVAELANKVLKERIVGQHALGRDGALQIA